MSKLLCISVGSMHWKIKGVRTLFGVQNDEQPIRVANGKKSGHRTLFLIHRRSEQVRHGQLGFAEAAARSQTLFQPQTLGRRHRPGRMSKGRPRRMLSRRLSTSAPVCG